MSAGAVRRSLRRRLSPRYVFFGSPVTGATHYIHPDGCATYLESGVFEEAVRRGISSTEVYTAAAAGLHTIEGIEAVRGGTPVEWVAAHEESQRCPGSTST